MIKRIIYPPIWFLLGLLGIAVMYFQLPQARFSSLPVHVAGVMLLLGGIALVLSAAGLFRKAETDLVPFKNVTAMVTAGPYRFTRNPMYLGMALGLLGIGFLVGSLAGLIVVPVFMLVIQLRFILPEEDLMRAKFGEQYSEYSQRVRRWL